MTYWLTMPTDPETISHVRGYFGLDYLNITYCQIFDSIEKIREKYDISDEQASKLKPFREGKYTGYCFFTDFSEAKKQILDEAEKIWASITDEDIIEKLKIGAVCWNYYLSNTQRGPYIAPDPDSRIRQIAAGLFSDKVKEYPLFRDYYPKAWVSPRVKWVKQNSEVYV